ncbi:TetR family transcriptional regulator C-terminal domain-containing protein [Donghicola eburneus]|uniref:TetR family transcriptional regulator n=1 Tax=Donghicola eburneus TaxID=393278 RepID=A0A1M4MZH1_9RHOB|nr:TetR family transcriptional regulator [Donghicola eburneus]SFQ53141.1 transcriptional regulator, TetR family [Donghicola eburneus]
MTQRKPMTRIQRKNTEAILEAALVMFSQYGFRGSTLDQIAKAAGLSKPNLLYYFKSKEAIFTEVLEGLLDNWLDPLREMKEDGDAIEEILAYMKRKLQMSRDFPRESRLFANEIIQGAPRMMHAIEGELKELVDEKVKIIRKWSADGRIAEIDPYHLIFSIWSLTQHYADFDVQVRAILREDTDEIFDEAESYLTTLFTRMLTP